MREGVRTIATESLNRLQPAHSPIANESTNLQGCHETRRTVLAGVAMLPALSLPAVAEDHSDAETVNLARRLLAGIESEYRLRLAVEGAWAASERIRHQLLADDPHLQYQAGRVRELLQDTEQGRRHAIAYDRWNEACRECRAISERILAKEADTGPSIAAHVLAHDYLHRDFGSSKGEPLVRAAAAMLGAKVPTRIDDNVQKELHRAVQSRADVA